METRNKFIILNPYLYHYEVIETIINRLGWICKLDIASEPIKPNDITIICHNMSQFNEYITKKYKGINFVTLVTDMANTSALKFEQTINEYIKTLTLGNNTDEHTGENTVYVINTTHYEMELFSVDIKDKLRLEKLQRIGKYGNYYPLNVDNKIKYYYMIHDLMNYLDKSTRPISDNIICMTPLQASAMRRIKPRVMPCISLPLCDNYDNIKKQRMELGYPIILLQGSFNRRYKSLLISTLVKLNKMYPKIPKFEIHILSKIQISYTFRKRFKNLIKVKKLKYYIDYHNAAVKCWAIMTLVSPYTHPQYYSDEHIDALQDKPIAKTTSSLTSSINYGEAYKQVFIIEPTLYSIYANADWPWLRDNSILHKCNNLTMEEQVAEFGAAINSAVLRYYDEYKMYINTKDTN